MHLHLPRSTIPGNPAVPQILRYEEARHGSNGIGYRICNSCFTIGNKRLDHLQDTAQDNEPEENYYKAFFSGIGHSSKKRQDGVCKDVLKFVPHIKTERRENITGNDRDYREHYDARPEQ